MNKIYQIYQVSDSTGETLDRIFLAIKAQFSNFECKTIHFSFTRTKNQINKIISKCYKKAEHFINLASNSLSIFKDTREKKILQNLTSFSLERSF